ncbi:hypothetical protein BCR33DRAFT_727388 [Rhizoclosmatium globosum]|uniref:Uncharacterized protein n=1 Tax=Rhizoclosmatium globosum TaxID=329046 RepID=A0A1Y2AQA3_9FUNG|nr:hypothetical protein BCR33DRAFT_727374 [Rhizoclosmatium globosum]ORY24656.1 hypothetical protein BCR33DRAFT_727388 [Rhizoclosmatium globosum]|eukprot:ORY24654.1 hypothetical protein BCR33DRAFT_727374 [Rhizoclosmatium globosum]
MAQQPNQFNNNNNHIPPPNPRNSDNGAEDEEEEEEEEEDEGANEEDEWYQGLGSPSPPTSPSHVPSSQSNPSDSDSSDDHPARRKRSKSPARSPLRSTRKASFKQTKFDFLQSDLHRIPAGRKAAVYINALSTELLKPMREITSSSRPSSYNIFNDRSSYKVLQVLRELHNAACRMSSSDRKSFIDQRDRQTVSRSRMERVKSHLDAAVSTLTDYPQWSGKDAARWLTKVLESDESTIARDFASKSAAEFTRELASAAKLEDSRKGNRGTTCSHCRKSGHSHADCRSLCERGRACFFKKTQCIGQNDRSRDRPRDYRDYRRDRSRSPRRDRSRSPQRDRFRRGGERGGERERERGRARS